jgi:hypothetical protein
MAQEWQSAGRSADSPKMWSKDEKGDGLPSPGDA